MFGLGFGELVLILLIALIFIGPKKLPELAKGLGKGIREFQDAAKGFSDQMQKDIETPKSETTHTPQIADATQQPESKTTGSQTQDKDQHHS